MGRVNLGTARIVIILALAVGGIAVLANGFCERRRRPAAERRRGQRDDEPVRVQPDQLAHPAAEGDPEPADRRCADRGLQRHQPDGARRGGAATPGRPTGTWRRRIRPTRIQNPFRRRSSTSAVGRMRRRTGRTPGTSPTRTSTARRCRSWIRSWRWTSSPTRRRSSSWGSIRRCAGGETGSG